ncbi:HPF/RaiA family ribosome-associated protein [Algiphilus sp.]|uniref:HPF/RaiA family ribosome-associated protein n=1 Tax=Algiphilus sp. TaxID=1872431 RepID=UPI001CA62AA5|nr:HPF/RaiA family ribosome-associated protein [Algiphilus sp.]MBY8966237.1 HPF/RaiA family ribosome-associated protein [Algiphilus acroporae]MCI5063180.1 HPF/RaiA family ribosome-associated protein [Algiphilus sp.]MCI5103682.1 HPF/RaiA family ribosome-associated protein [Algiphilus sp.]MCR9091580.1 HPF/RaiA family ribosome-associated protein [Pseudomonadota bacterium]
METEVHHGDGVERSPALEQYIEARLERLRPQYGDRLTRVRAFLKDVNGQKGGVDKSCKLEARPAGKDPIVVEAQDADWYAAVRDAEGKLERALAHRLLPDH